MSGTGTSGGTNTGYTLEELQEQLEEVEREMEEKGRARRCSQKPSGSRKP